MVSRKEEGTGAPRGRTGRDVSGYRVKEVVKFIVGRMAPDGRLRISLAEIAKGIGCSSASVHRALRYLEEQGELEVDRSTMPNSLRYMGIENALRTDRTAEIAQILADIDSAQRRLKTQLDALLRDDAQLKKAAAVWMELGPRLIEEIYFPNRGELLLGFRFETPPPRSYLPDKEGEAPPNTPPNADPDH